MFSKQKEKGVAIHFLCSPVFGCRVEYCLVTHGHPPGTDVCDGSFGTIGPSLTITWIIELNFCQGSFPRNMEVALGHYPNRKPGPNKSSFLTEPQSLYRSPPCSPPSEQQRPPFGSSPQSPGAGLISLLCVCL